MIGHIAAWAAFAGLGVAAYVAIAATIGHALRDVRRNNTIALARFDDEADLRRILDAPLLKPEWKRSDYLDERHVH